MKVLFFDIDGTLLDRDERVPKSTEEALDLAKEHGHKRILCTGRSKCAVKQLMKKYDFDGCVCSAGAYVEYQEQVVNGETIETAAFHQLVDFLEGSESFYGLQCKEYAACPVEMKKDYEKTFGAAEEDKEEKPDDIGKTFIFVDDIRAVKGAEKAFYFGANVGVEEAGRILGEAFDVRPASYNMPDANHGEISINGVTKSYGMQKLLEFLGADRMDTIAFGDGYNDLEMLEFAEIGVAMGNAVEELKQVADYVTEPVDEDGIYRAMKFLHVI